MAIKPRHLLLIVPWSSAVSFERLLCQCISVILLCISRNPGLHFEKYHIICYHWTKVELYLWAHIQFKLKINCEDSCRSTRLELILSCDEMTSYVLFFQGKALGQMLLDFKIKNVPDILPSVIEPSLWGLSLNLFTSDTTFWFLRLFFMETPITVAIFKKIWK